MLQSSGESRDPETEVQVVVECMTGLSLSEAELIHWFENFNVILLSAGRAFPISKLTVAVLSS
jgi:hypothetical protein